MSRIQEYGFGKIVIDGAEYRSDVIVFPDRVDASWWRKEGHKLYPEDLPFLKDDPPDVLIIGQGKFGFMQVTEEMKRHLAELGIDWHAHPTGKAVQVYNEMFRRRNVRLIGAFHLTC